MAFAEAGDYEVQALEAGSGQAVQHLQCLQREDLFWSDNYWKEPYFRADYDYEDYAPAYCVGYSGYAQYGGRIEDSEKSLCANFVRIKGDSRLSWDEALEAVRMAWRRAANATALDPQRSPAGLAQAHRAA